MTYHVSYTQLDFRDSHPRFIRGVCEDSHWYTRSNVHQDLLDCSGDYESLHSSAIVHKLIHMQLNALLDFASLPGNSRNYSPRWEGPPADKLLPWGQLAAADVLNSAVGLLTINNTTPEPPR